MPSTEAATSASFGIHLRLPVIRLAPFRDPDRQSTINELLTALRGDSFTA
jgi:hypothetical protein